MRFEPAFVPPPSSNSLQWACPAPTASSTTTSSTPATSTDPTTSAATTTATTTTATATTTTATATATTTTATATTTASPATLTPSPENPQGLLRRAAEPAFVRIRQDCQRASDRVLPLLDHLEQHLFDPDLNVNQLKKACGARDNSIVIHFHAEIGQTPKTYLTGRRLETAARLLRETNLRIWQISDLVGYSALGVFSKAFDRWAGLRPLYYRSQEAARNSEQAPAAPEIFDGEFLERAMTDQLTEDESSRLIARLCEIYGLNLAAFAPVAS